MDIIPVLGLTVFVGGLCFLAGQGILRACRPEPEASGAVESCPLEGLTEVPDTVPSEWVQAYWAEQDG